MKRPDMYRRFAVFLALATAGCATQPAARPTAFAVFFQPYSVGLDQAALATIAGAAKAAKAAPNDHIMLVGAADNTGSSDGNRSLSQARAEAVLSALVWDGVDRTRLHAEGRGESGQLFDMTQSDRRVIIKLED